MMSATKQWVRGLRKGLELIVWAVKKKKKKEEESVLWGVAHESSPRKYGAFAIR